LSTDASPRLDEREAALAQRCSPSAAEYLPYLRDHLLFPEVLARLEATQGTIFQLDVEQTFFEVIKAHPAAADRKSAADRKATRAISKPR
jgi:hypothetical protein